MFVDISVWFNNLLRMSFFAKMQLLLARFFLLAGPSQDVFLPSHIPYEGKGVVYFLYITLCKSNARF